MRKESKVDLKMDEKNKTVTAASSLGNKNTNVVHYKLHRDSK